MADNILFSEKQKFQQWWVWLFLIGANILTGFAVFMQVVQGEPLGNNPIGDTGLFIILGFVILLSLFILSLNLHTQIKADGVYIKFFPFHKSYRYYPWEQMTKCFVRQYSPLKEYGGWGVRIGLNGKAFNVSGNKGLQIEFVDGKNLLIGTNQPEKLTEVLKKMEKLKP